MSPEAFTINLKQQSISTPSGALFSSARDHRFVLWRVWRQNQHIVHFIGLNPSAADDKENDPTIRRCIQFAKSWGYGGMMITNLFSFRTAFPRELKASTLPLMPENDRYIRACHQLAEKTVVIWGNDGSFGNRAQTISSFFHPLFCIRKNKTGHPAHPLYLPGKLRPKAYTFDMS